MKEICFNKSPIFFIFNGYISLLRNYSEMIRKIFKNITLFFEYLKCFDDFGVGNEFESDILPQKNFNLFQIETLLWSIF